MLGSLYAALHPPAFTRSLHANTNFTTLTKACRSLFCTIFQGTKGYVGPKGDEGEAGDPGNDVSNLYKAESSFSVNTVQELWAGPLTLPCLWVRAHQTL